MPYRARLNHFTADAIKSSLFLPPNNESPGIDCMSSEFFKHCTKFISKTSLKCLTISQNTETSLKHGQKNCAAPFLTHWGRATHTCVGKPTIIGSDNGLSPGRREAIIRTNAEILLIGPLGTNFSEILIGIQTFSFRKMHLKLSSAKWRPFCLGLNELKPSHIGDCQLLRHCGTRNIWTDIQESSAETSGGGEWSF